MEKSASKQFIGTYYRRDLGIMVRHIEPYVIIEPLFVNTWYRWFLMLMCLSSNQIKINGFFDVFFLHFSLFDLHSTLSSSVAECRKIVDATEKEKLKKEQFE